ncbi:protein far1-related sequence 5-like [Gigaspora margarita]|uniref:Protein far1-related sequence 5-like n=1 Tax=Gigaspora margarita TaxID=4874 RepID=A0A8H4A8H9_GIGMA|nr:protein far1-related sequence 5-like [Gigaspora margarita]
MFTKYEPDQSYFEKSFIQVVSHRHDILSDYYGSNVAIDLLTTYNTIFKDTENVLKDYLFELAPSEILSYITIAQRTKNHAIQELYFINEIRTSNVYIPSIRKKINKRIEFGSTKSVVKTSIQNAIEKESPILANNKQQPLSNNVSYNIIEISSPEYYKPRGYPPKCLELATEKNYRLCKSQSSKPVVIVKKKNIILEDM